MKQVYRYDKDGRYLEPILLESEEPTPNNCTDIPIPQPNWKPVFDGVKWVETATDEEKNPPVIPQPSVEDKLVQMEQDVADLWYVTMMGGLA